MLGFPDNPNFGADKEKLASFLNEQFRAGTPAYKVLDQIRAFPRPIVCDFNNVLANNIQPLVSNPEAPDFLRALRQIGDIFVVTTVDSHDTVSSFMKKADLWTNDLILIVAGNYEFITQHADENVQQNATDLINKFLLMAKAFGWIATDFTERDFVTVPAAKHVAPIFSKPFLIPIIDDSWFATDNNPGMLGIRVKPFDESYGQDAHTLSEAIDIVKTHYSRLP